MNILGLIDEARHQYMTDTIDDPDTLLFHSSHRWGSPVIEAICKDLGSYTAMGNSFAYQLIRGDKLTLLGLKVVYSDIGITEKEFALYNSENATRNVLKGYRPLPEFKIFPIYYVTIPREILERNK